MVRGIARSLLLVLILGSAFLTGASARAVLRDPLLHPLIAATADQITAATDRMMATEATPEHLASLIDLRLHEEPHNWVALDALNEVAAEQGVVFAPDLEQAVKTARALDEGWFAQIGGCAACAWDIARCSLSQAMVCKAPILLTPVEDLRGVIKAGVDYSTGNDIDQLDLGLSVVGLSATALVVVSGGATGALKGGAALVRLARGMNLLSPRLSALLVDTLRGAIDWAAIPAVRSSDDLVRTVRMGAIAPAVVIAGDLGRMTETIGPVRALHLLPMVDDAADARALTRATEALGARVVGRAEVLGKARLFRATVRTGSVAATLVSGLVGLLVGLGMVLSGLVQTAMMRGLRRLAR
jgi:hypothetical protein